MALVWEDLVIENRNSGMLAPKVLWSKRAKVPGGWLVAIHMAESGGLTFYPDPEHLWNGHSLNVDNQKDSLLRPSQASEEA